MMINYTKREGPMRIPRSGPVARHVVNRQFYKERPLGAVVQQKSSGHITSTLDVEFRGIRPGFLLVVTLIPFGQMVSGE